MPTLPKDGTIRDEPGDLSLDPAFREEERLREDAREWRKGDRERQTPPGRSHTPGSGTGLTSAGL